MEAWLAELEMEVDPIQNIMNNHQQCETMEAEFTEQLSAILGEDFPYPYSSERNNTTSPDGCDIDDIIFAQLNQSPQIFDQCENAINKINDNDFQESQQIKEANSKQATREGAKRKRQPNQVQDHIIAERRRRELLGQMFISLSSLVPGLKKMDKTTVLGEAITYMKKLQEKVKQLEEVVAKRTIKSVVLVNKTQFKVNDDNDSSSTVDNNSLSGGGGGGGGGGREVDKSIDSLPEIEVRILGETVLLKVYCENKTGILIRLFNELEKHNLSVTNCSVIPFESMVLDISIIAQMQRGFNMNTNNFLGDLRTTFRSSSD